MNAANSHRASYYDLGALPGTVSHRQSAAITARRSRAFVVLDHAEYKAQCDLARDSRTASGVYDIEWEKQQAKEQHEQQLQQQEGPARPRGQLKAMFTVYPFRDANWIINIVFVMGSTSFAINGFFGLLPLIAPETAFPTEATLAVPLTNAIGAAHFVVAGTLALPAIWNTAAGNLHEPQPEAPTSKFEPDEEQAKVAAYQPALLTGASWRWLPSWGMLKNALRTTPFLSALLQTLGGFVFTISTVFGFPGMLAPDDLTGLASFVFTPLLIGGGIFAIANIMLLLFAQEKWYKPNPASAAWQASLWNIIASVLFSVTGVVLLNGDFLGGAWASFIGSWAFLFGSIISWYDMMAFYCD